MITFNSWYPHDKKIHMSKLTMIRMTKSEVSGLQNVLQNMSMEGLNDHKQQRI